VNEGKPIPRAEMVLGKPNLIAGKLHYPLRPTSNTESGDVMYVFHDALCNGIKESEFVDKKRKIKRKMYSMWLGGVSTPLSPGAKTTLAETDECMGLMLNHIAHEEPLVHHLDQECGFTLRNSVLNAQYEQPTVFFDVEFDNEKNVFKNCFITRDDLWVRKPGSDGAKTHTITTPSQLPQESFVCTVSVQLKSLVVDTKNKSANQTWRVRHLTIHAKAKVPQVKRNADKRWDLFVPPPPPKFAHVEEKSDVAAIEDDEEDN
jgi:hypothetical protein